MRADVRVEESLQPIERLGHRDPTAPRLEGERWMESNFDGSVIATPRDARKNLGGCAAREQQWTAVQRHEPIGWRLFGLALDSRGYKTVRSAVRERRDPAARPKARERGRDGLARAQCTNAKTSAAFFEESLHRGETVRPRESIDAPDLGGQSLERGFPRSKMSAQENRGRPRGARIPENGASFLVEEHTRPLARSRCEEIAERSRECAMGLACRHVGSVTKRFGFRPAEPSLDRADALRVGPRVDIGQHDGQ